MKVKKREDQLTLKSIWLRRKENLKWKLNNQKLFYRDVT